MANLVTRKLTSGNAVVAGVGWATPLNAANRNGAFATHAAGTDNWLVVSGFGGTGPLGIQAKDLPNRSTIKGFRVYVQGYADPLAGAQGVRLALSKDGSTVVGTTRFLGLPASAAAELGAEGDSATGDPLFGATWTLEEVRAATFGVGVRVETLEGNPRNIDNLGVEILYSGEGYEWYPQIRLAPRNGPGKTIDLRTSFQDAGQPTKIDVDYTPMVERHETINLRLRPHRRGFRPQVALTFDLHTAEDEAAIAEVLTAAVEPETKLYLSLDGITERQVELSRLVGPDALGGKTFVGSRHVLTFQAVDLIPTKPALGSGRW